MTELYAIYGASGCGRSLMPVARAQLKRLGNSAEIVFIDDSLVAETIINSHRAMNYAAFKAQPATQKHVLIAIANSQVREKISIQLEQDAIELWSVQADNAVLMDKVEIAAGAALSPFVSITSNIKIGKCFHANLYCYVEHDCVIGDHTILASNAQLAGHVEVGDWAIVGGMAGAHQFVKVGAHAMVGGGTIMLKDVPPFVLSSGNPATPFGINSEGLKRRGFTSEQIMSIKRAYKAIYRQDLTIEQAIVAINAAAADEPNSTAALHLMSAFLTQATRGIIR